MLYGDTGILGVLLMRFSGDVFPTRVPVWWGRRGVVGPHPDVKGVTGKQIVIRHPKTLSGLEAILASILRGPKELRRPLDDMNSMLWELMDGSNDFSTICSLMDSTFHERIAPVEERVRASIAKFYSLGLAVIRQSPLSNEWNVSARFDPTGVLEPPSEKLELDPEEE